MRTQRGTYLESEIQRVVDYLNGAGYHAHKNHAQRTLDGTFIQGEPYDYEIFANGKLTCFDAKECKGKRWNFRNAKPAQIKNLSNCKKQGAEAFFLVYFSPPVNRLVKYDVDKLISAMAAGVKSFTADEGVTWDWKEAISDQG